MQNSQPVGGFQFELLGVNIESTSGGLAESNGFEIAVNPGMIMGYTLDAGLIPPGVGMLTRVHFSETYSDNTEHKKYICLVMTKTENKSDSFFKGYNKHTIERR